MNNTVLFQKRRQRYLSPEVTVVEFVMERGFQASGASTSNFNTTDWDEGTSSGSMGTSSFGETSWDI